MIDAVWRDEHPNKQQKSTVEGEVLAGVVARGGTVLKVHRGIPPLGGGVLVGDARTRPPRVDGVSVYVIGDVTSEVVVLRTGR